MTTQRDHAAKTRCDHGRGDAPDFPQDQTCSSVFAEPMSKFATNAWPSHVRSHQRIPIRGYRLRFRGSHLVPNGNPCGVDGFDLHAARDPRKDGVDSEELAGNVPPDAPDLNRNRHPISDVHKTQSYNGPCYRLGRRTAAGRRHGNLTRDGRFFEYFRAVMSEGYVSQLCRTEK